MEALAFAIGMSPTMSWLPTVPIVSVASCVCIVRTTSASDSMLRVTSGCWLE